MIVKLANLTRFISIEESKLQAHISTNHSTGSQLDSSGALKASSRTMSYFQKVDLSLIQSTYDLYDIDFKLFQYSLEGFSGVLTKPMP